MVRCAQARNLSDQILADLAQVCVVCVNEFKTVSRCAGFNVKKFYKKKAYTLKKISLRGIKRKSIGKGLYIEQQFPLRGLKN